MKWMKSFLPTGTWMWFKSILSLCLKMGLRDCSLIMNWGIGKLEGGWVFLGYYHTGFSFLMFWHTLTSKSLTWNINTWSSGCNALAFYVLYVYILSRATSHVFFLSQNTFTPWVKLFLHLYDLVMLLYSESRFSCQSA